MNGRIDIEEPIIEEPLNEEKPKYYGKPLNGLILIKRTTDVKAKIGGIHVPQNAQQKPCEGIVLAVGEERVTEFGAKIPKVCQIGDRILYGKYAGLEVEVDGNEFMILKEGEILMILPPKDPTLMEETEPERKSFLLQ